MNRRDANRLDYRVTNQVTDQTWIMRYRNPDMVVRYGLMRDTVPPGSYKIELLNPPRFDTSGPVYAFKRA